MSNQRSTPPDVSSVEGSFDAEEEQKKEEETRGTRGGGGSVRHWRKPESRPVKISRGQTTIGFGPSNRPVAWQTDPRCRRDGSRQHRPPALSSLPPPLPPTFKPPTKNSVPQVPVGGADFTARTAHSISGLYNPGTTPFYPFLFVCRPWVRRFHQAETPIAKALLLECSGLLPTAARCRHFHDDVNAGGFSQVAGEENTRPEEQSVYVRTFARAPVALSPLYPSLIVWILSATFVSFSLMIEPTEPIRVHVRNDCKPASESYPRQRLLLRASIFSVRLWKFLERYG